MNLVAELLLNNGSIPELQEIGKKAGWLNRSLGLKLSAVWFFVLMMLLMLAGVTGAPDEVLGGLAILGFFGGLFLSMLSVMFLPKSSRVGAADGIPDSHQIRQVSGSVANPALPASHSIPVDAYAPPAPGGWRQTNDLEPSSVTEGTTRIFNSKENS